MEVRVVCGLSATIATFRPTNAFSNVDLPALGRPTKETNPDLNFLLMSYRLGPADAHLLHPQFVAGQHFNAHAVALHHFSGLGNAPQPFAQQAAHRGGFDLFLAMEGIEKIGDAVQIEIAGDDVSAAAVFLDIAVGLVLVADLSDDHLEQIFHGGQAGGIAVLVHHNHHVRILLLHLAHQVAHRLGLGHEQDGPHQLADRAVGALGFVQLEHVAHVHEADDTVDALLEYRDPRILFGDDKLPQLLQGGIGGDGYDVGTRRHDLADHLVAEFH